MRALFIRASWAAAALLSATMGAPPAAAQARPAPRVEISANAGALTGSSKFTESESLTVNAETATLTAAHGAKTAVGFDVGGAVKIVQQLWIGVQYATSDTKPGASVTALIPHPLQFNAPRTVQGSVGGLVHNERNVHVDLMYALPLRALDVKVLGGPTFFTVRQDFVSNVAVNETYPFDTATFASATTTRLSKGAAGFNAGVDISRPLSSVIGIGALIRYSRADVKFDDQAIGRQTVKAGGVEAAGGVRIRF